MCMVLMSTSVLDFTYKSSEEEMTELWPRYVQSTNDPIADNRTTFEEHTLSVHVPHTLCAEYKHPDI